MKRFIMLTLSLFLIFGAGSDFAYAKKTTKTPTPVVSTKGVTVVKSSKTKTISKLPAKSVTVRINGINFYRNGSKYYKKVGAQFILTPPPFGLRVAIIPAMHTVFRFNNINYYCAEGVIYQATSDNQFEVVEPQEGMIIPELPEVNVNQVNINGTVYFEFEGILYKQIPTESGLQYKVAGKLSI